MVPEDGCLWIYDTDDEQTVAFTPDGIEYVREMLPEYKRNRSPPAVLNGWLLLWRMRRASAIETDLFQIQAKILSDRYEYATGIGPRITERVIKRFDQQRLGDR